MRFRPALAGILLVASICASRSAFAQDAGLSAVWKDGESRTSYSEVSQSTTRFFALLPACDAASPTITFAATFPGKRVSGTPATIDYRADLGIHVASTFVRTRTLTLIIDGDRSMPIDLSNVMHPGVFQTPGETLDNATATMDLVDFVKLAAARTIQMNVFGATCSVSTGQMRAFQQFALSLLGQR